MTTTRQTPKQEIDNFVDKYLKPFLEQESFVRRGRTWVKDEDGFSFIINVQADKWNTAGDIAKFFVNYGVFAPSLYEDYFHMAIPKQPMEYDCILRYRLRTKKGEEAWSAHVEQRRFFFGNKYNGNGEEIIEAIESQSFKLFDEIQSIEDIRKKSR
jgi:uncharacterized protein DUF4304